MADFAWLMRRLKAMSLPEVAWRISQRRIQKKEAKRFQQNRTAVCGSVFYSELAGLRIHAEKLHLNLSNEDYSLGTAIPLLGGYSYAVYKKRWNAGFQTDNTWPDTFSYQLSYKQRDDIGDARTNWELNRHFQFALLAKDYRASGDQKYLNELQDLFYDWNEKNPFLWGISWTSVMEVAIRCSNWCYAYCMLDGMENTAKLQESLRIGILNMTAYLADHYSRYSSANNHLIVEAYAIGQSGILFDHQPWIQLAVTILTEQLPIQNYPDGVNREQSLHYQSFYMEAMGLMMRLMQKNGIAIPEQWNVMLDKMCTYIANCTGAHGEMLVFGDDDAGKILDLHGGLNHYAYVLGMFSCLLKKRYLDISAVDCENLCWLFSAEDRANADSGELYHAPRYVCYREGGISILRSKDHRVLIGVDHGALGFGRIAAHGHADALSFQLYADGINVFTDPGTYIYHCDPESRNAYRKTENHNTVCINGKDQSQMLGAFLWGRKAECTLTAFEEKDGCVSLTAEHDGYGQIQVRRRFAFDGERHLTIWDTIAGACSVKGHFVLSPGTVVDSVSDMQAAFHILGKTALLTLSVENGSAVWNSKTIHCSKAYGIQEDTVVLYYEGTGSSHITVKTDIVLGL